MPEQEASTPATSVQRLQELCADPHLRLLVAGNPAAPGHLLMRLAKDQDAQVRQAVAGNPNTPWPILEHLAGEFPRAFLHNPVGPLQLLARPEQITINPRFWDALLREATIPSPWWSWLRSHSVLGTRQAVHLHVQYVGEITHFAGTLDVEVEVRRAVAGNPQTPVEMLLTLAQDRNGRVRKMVATNVHTPVEALHLLARDEKWQVRAAVAGHPQTPPEVLQALARDPDVDVRETVAQNPQTPAEVLHSLARDGRDRVRETVAANVQTPPEVLWTLAQEKAEALRTRVAQNPQTSARVLRILAQDKSWGVREAVAANPQTPAEVLQALAQDKSLRTRVVQNPQTPPEVLQTLVRHPDATVREAVAGNWRISAEMLRTLAQDREKHVRKAVAAHPQTPAEVFHLLVQDQEEEVRRMATFVQKLLAHSEITWRNKGEWEQWKNITRIRDVGVEKQLDLVAVLESPNTVRQIIMEVLAADWDTALVQAAFMGHDGQEHIMAPFLPPIALQKLAASPSWEIRSLVALHAQTPQETRQILGQDGNRYVRAMARTKAAQMGEQGTD